MIGERQAVTLDGRFAGMLVQQLEPVSKPLTPTARP
jgi:hypothetical protein